MKLKSCPFCGGKADLDFHNPDDEIIYVYGPIKWFVYCKDCGCGTVDFDYLGTAVTVWNNRMLK